MRWAINGCDRDSGEDIQLTVDAVTEEEAAAKAAKYGVLVAECRPLQMQSAPVATKTVPQTRRGSARDFSPRAVTGAPEKPAAVNEVTAPSQVAEESLPELSLAVLPVPLGFGSMSAVLTAHPLIGAAIILHFVWAGLMVLIGMIQIASDGPGLGAWNILIAAAYVVIGIGLVRGKFWGWNVGIVTNLLNAIMGIYQILTQQAWLLGLLLILEILIIVFLWMERGLFPKPQTASAAAGASQSPKPTKPATPWNRFLRGGVLGMIDERFTTVSDAQIQISGNTKAEKTKRVLLLAGGGILGFAVLIGIVIALPGLTSNHRSAGSSPGASSSSDDSAPAMNFAEFDAKFGQSATALVLGLPGGSDNMTTAQVESSRKEVMGRKIHGEGVVIDVVGNQVLIKHRLFTTTNEVALIVRDSDIPVLNKGDIVEYTGGVAGFGSPYPFTLSNGVIVNSRSASGDEQKQVWDANDKAEQK
jgi:hypothetical protein